MGSASIRRGSVQTTTIIISFRERARQRRCIPVRNGISFSRWTVSLTKFDFNSGSHLSESKIWISLIRRGRINGSVGANENSAGNGDERIFRSFFQRWFRRNGRRRKGGEGGIRGIREKKSLFISPLAPSCPHLRKQKPIRTLTRRTRNIKESARLLMQKCKGIQYDGVIIWKVQLSFDQAGEVVWVIKSERFAGAVRTSTSQPCLWSIYRRFPRLNARWSPMNMENPSAEVTPRYYRLPSSNCRSSFKRSRCDVALPKKFLRRTNHPRYNPQSQSPSLSIPKHGSISNPNRTLY